MNSKVLSTLEFNKIIDRLSQYCCTYLGRAICFDTKISTNIDEVQKRLTMVTQTQDLILKLGNIPITEINDIKPCLKKANIDGILNFKELLDIAHVLKVSREIKQYISSSPTLNLEEFDLIIRYFENIYSNSRIENLILDNIYDEQTINDKASTELYNIRKSILQLENKVKDTLQNYVSSPTYLKYLQDTVITIRNNRFVIPVKQEYKSNISGIVHDTSASGSTLFIEPNNIVEMNNNISKLKNDETIEIEKICYEYTLEIQKISDNISNNLNILGILDFMQAKSKYSLDNNMYEPILNNEKYINLIDARHPLIPKETVVPINVEINNKYNCMIITGPNTGGKTVTLKIIGLLTLMTQYGMHIPARSGSNISVFNNIFTDIGDEQSIEQNLSTFSSHMTNIIDITNKVKDNSLIIIDELGSGTDPVEGAALAIGILEYLNTKNSITLCTTHYSELKTYAMSKPNILNACTQFDLKTLKPTYKLIIGIPGKSNAFAISQKLGLDKDIIETSSKYIAKNNVDFEEILAKLNKEKDEIEKLKKNTQSEYSKIRLEREQIEKEKEKLITQKDNILQHATNEAKSMVLDAKQEINKIISDIYELKKKDTIQIQNSKTSINEKLNKKIDKLSQTKKSKDLNAKLNTTIDDLSVGQLVYIPSLDKMASVLNINDENNILVQIGVIKTTLSADKIKIMEPNKQQEKKKNIIKFDIENKSKNINSSINVIGKTIDEAIYEIDKYLDDAYLSKIGMITIIHGKRYW